MKCLHTFVVLAYKESPDLERCIKSVLNQKYKSNVIIATSTPNDYITKLAKKYKLNIKVNEDSKHRIGDDFDFAIKAGETKLVTIAHQDDVYDYEYSYEVVNKFNQNSKSTIIFTDYYEIKDGKKVDSNSNLKIKRFLLKPLKKDKNYTKKWAKRHVIKYGNAISCPAVTFNKDKIVFPVFDCDLKCNVDWNAWEKLSKLDGGFSFVNKILMGHTISEETTTTQIIKSGIRTKEDYEIFRRFWPKFIATILTKIYKKSEKSNSVRRK